MKAVLVLEDGKAFWGEAFGAVGEATGEVVFNTGLTGYQELLTDPSYKGQMVTMTYPHIGNTGINPEDWESARFHLNGLIVRDLCRVPSNWRATQTLAECLDEQGVMALSGVDTRALTRHIRTRGAMKGIMSVHTDDLGGLQERAKAAPGTSDVDLVAQVTCQSAYEWTEGTSPQWRVPDPLQEQVQGAHILAYDCGIKRNMLRLLVDLGCRVTVVPAFTTAEEALARCPDGILLSNGPGDPRCVPYLVETVRKFLGRVPLFGICLGQQVLGLALGGRILKLPFGHHGANQPVRDLQTGEVHITSQNHNFVVDMDSLLQGEVEVTHINLNDNTLEGMRHTRWPVFSVQHHPEASMGPHDAEVLFRRFMISVSESKNTGASGLAGASGLTRTG